ncbi:hypothetical protein EDB19DRAFT_1837621 [Suillus lakei]|nr:hypothetical protein EDB19DRAFT_1837621 [Suillus lakei]
MQQGYIPSVFLCHPPPSSPQVFDYLLPYFPSSALLYLSVSLLSLGAGGRYSAHNGAPILLLHLLGLLGAGGSYSAHNGAPILLLHLLGLLGAGGSYSAHTGAPILLLHLLGLLGAGGELAVQDQCGEGPSTPALY